MLIENAFTVAAPVDFLWNYLLDVERIAPCMPGAELTEVVDDKNWKGRLNAKFGPVSMSFAGSVTVQERDDVVHRVKLTAKGMEAKGKGAANASVTSWLEAGADAGTTTVKMEADITLTGAAAQLSRGLLPEISKKLTQQFADCLQENMAAAQRASSSGPADPGGPVAARPAAAKPAGAKPVVAKPVGGIGLGISAIFAVISNIFRKLFGLKPTS